MRFENIESKMAYTTRGKCSVYYASRVSVFFEKSFRVPKVVPKNVLFHVLIVVTLLRQSPTYSLDKCNATLTHVAQG